MHSCIGLFEAVAALLVLCKHWFWTVGGVAVADAQVYSAIIQEASYAWVFILSVL